MEKKVQILIVEDERHYAVLLKKMMENLGYEVVGWATTPLEAFSMIIAQQPDIILLDILMNNQPQGFEIAQYLKTNFIDIPFIFTSSLLDKSYLQQAAQFKPHAYLPKPYKANELMVAIETAMATTQEEASQATTPEDTALHDILRNNFVFIKIRESYLVKIAVTDIIYFEADGNYCFFYCINNQKYCIRRNLSYIENRIQHYSFIRVHKSYLVQLSHIQKVTYDKIILQDQTILPMGRTYKEAVAKVTSDYL